MRHICNASRKLIGIARPQAQLSCGQAPALSSCLELNKIVVTTFRGPEKRDAAYLEELTKSLETTHGIGFAVIDVRGTDRAVGPPP